ncbi:MAG TPA: HEAT repeat domain-containing protein, partial [Verrucomicrobiae bacterium]|nr:HEAT repeat domain-containing protein [Verrucomicrobiae bacterium]
PIVYRKYDSPDEQFSFRAYPKGAWVLHMLRGQLGEALYRKCIKAYIERHAYGNVVTDDLKNVIEEFSGRSFDQFFDQWVYHAHHPELEVNYSWDARTKLAKLTVKQVQKVSEDVAVFNFPLAIRFKSHGTVTDREIVVKEKAGDFYFNLAEAPEIVRLDPNYQLLAKISFQVPNGLLYAQLADQTDVIGRIFAVEQLAARRDHEAVDRLKQALNNDPFYGVRVEAAKALRSIHSDDTFAALQASATQRDARVRREVATGINSFYKDEAYAAARKMIEAGKNPELVADAIQALAGYSKPEVRDLLLKNLDSRSYKNRLANAAITGVRSQDDPACLTPLREALARREKELTASSFNNGLDTLAYLARNETSKDATREFLLRYVDHPRESTARAAIAALGTLGDPKALPVIEKFAASDKDNPLHTAAVNARTALRAARKPVDDFKNLRDEVLELQKKDRELRHELDDLKKQVEAAKAQTTDSRKKSKR